MSQNQKIDTLKYSYSEFNNGGRLHLLSNGTFEHRKFVFGCTSDGEDKKGYCIQNKLKLK